MNKPRKIRVDVLMTEADCGAVDAWAADECRSRSSQILHIIRQALAARGERVAPLVDRAERIRNATRRSINGKAHA